MADICIEIKTRSSFYSMGRTFVCSGTGSPCPLFPTNYRLEIGLVHRPGRWHGSGFEKKYRQLLKSYGKGSFSRPYYRAYVMASTSSSANSNEANSKYFARPNDNGLSSDSEPEKTDDSFD